MDLPAGRPGVHAVAALTLLCACVPTFQSARIDPGFRVDVGAGLITDQSRGSSEDGDDALIYLAPTWGLSGSVELGLPVGFYWADLSRAQREPLVMPYVKFGILPAAGADHLALSIQTSGLLVPANVGLHYGRDLGRWEPQVSLTRIRSAGPAGDDPVVTRYQQDGQSLWLLAFGATLAGRGRPGVQVGLLRNSYIECCREVGPGRYTSDRVTFVDLVVIGRVGL